MGRDVRGSTSGTKRTASQKRVLRRLIGGVGMSAKNARWSECISDAVLLRSSARDDPSRFGSDADLTATASRSSPMLDGYVRAGSSWTSGERGVRRRRGVPRGLCARGRRDRGHGGGVAARGGGVPGAVRDAVGRVAAVVQSRIAGSCGDPGAAWAGGLGYRVVRESGVDVKQRGGRGIGVSIALGQVPRSMARVVRVLRRAEGRPNGSL